MSRLTDLENITQIRIKREAMGWVLFQLVALVAFLFGIVAVIHEINSSRDMEKLINKQAHKKKSIDIHWNGLTIEPKIDTFHIKTKNFGSHE